MVLARNILLYPFKIRGQPSHKTGCSKSPVQLPRAIENSRGQSELEVLCPNGQLKSKQGTECELKFCNYF